MKTRSTMPCSALTMTNHLIQVMFYLLFVSITSNAFMNIPFTTRTLPSSKIIFNLGVPQDNEVDAMAQLDERFPTSVDDQVRQVAAAINRAQDSGIVRHNVRMLLPIIGATELDDWPGGARQMMEAANPMVQSILTQVAQKRNSSVEDINDVIIDKSDGVRGLFSIASDPKEDSCAVLLPSAETLTDLENLSAQVGKSRNMIIVNAQWRRKSDFGGVFGGIFGNVASDFEFVNNFVPTYSLTSLMVEGEQIRILRSFPDDWRVFIMKVEDMEAYGSGRDSDGGISWFEIGSKPVENNVKGDLATFGIPSYSEIEEMIR